MNLRNFDLNLLVVLEAVLSEASITRAAKRLNLSQPAVSQGMARARDVFGDDLLVRDGSSMRLTPLGRRLAPQLKEFCARAEVLLSPIEFDPATVEYNFNVHCNDLSELLILPPLIAGVSQQAPNSTLVIRPVEPHLIDATVDLAIIGAPLPQGPFVSRDLYEDHFVLITRIGHPAMKKRLTAERFAMLPHALVSPTGNGMVGPIDMALEQLGLSRRITLSVTRFVTLPQIISSTDFVAAVPSRFAKRADVQNLCNVWPLPFKSPRFTMRMLWHRIHDADPAHEWLRSLLPNEGER